MKRLIGIIALSIFAVGMFMLSAGFIYPGYSVFIFSPVFEGNVTICGEKITLTEREDEPHGVISAEYNLIADEAGENINIYMPILFSGLENPDSFSLSADGTVLEPEVYLFSSKNSNDTSEDFIPLYMIGNIPKSTFDTPAEEKLGKLYTVNPEAELPSGASIGIVSEEEYRVVSYGYSGNYTNLDWLGGTGVYIYIVDGGESLNLTINGEDSEGIFDVQDMTVMQFLDNYAHERYETERLKLIGGLFSGEITFIEDYISGDLLGYCLILKYEYTLSGAISTITYQYGCDYGSDIDKLSLLIEPAPPDLCSGKTCSTFVYENISAVDFQGIDIEDDGYLSGEFYGELIMAYAHNDSGPSPEPDDGDGEDSPNLANDSIGGDFFIYLAYVFSFLFGYSKIALFLFGSLPNNDVLPVYIIIISIAIEIIPVLLHIISLKKNKKVVEMLIGKNDILRIK